MDTMTPSTDKGEPPRLTKWDWERAVRESDLRTTMKALLWALGTRMSRDGGDCFPSADTIAADASLTRSSVFVLLKEAATAGWLEVVPKGGRASGAGGTGKTNLYLPRIPGRATIRVDQTVASVRPEGSRPGSAGATVRVHRGQPSGDTGRNQTKDQTRNQEEGAVLLDRDDLEESLWRFLLLQQTAGLGLPKDEASDEAACLMLTAARALGCPDEALLKHRSVWLRLHRQVVDALAAGAGRGRLLEAISGEEPPAKVRCWPAFLGTRLDDVPAEAKRAVTA